MEGCLSSTKHFLVNERYTFWKVTVGKYDEEKGWSSRVVKER